MITKKPNKKPARSTAAEPWEVERLHKEFPVKSEEELEKALENCKAEIPEPQTKEKITNCVQRKISK